MENAIIPVNSMTLLWSCYIPVLILLEMELLFSKFSAGFRNELLWHTASSDRFKRRHILGTL